MEITIHHPETQDKFKKLTEQATKAHIYAISYYINMLKCPREQKIAIINEIIRQAENFHLY